MEIGRACPVYQIFNLAVCAKKQKKWGVGEVKDLFEDLEQEVTRLSQMTNDLLLLENVDNKSVKIKSPFSTNTRLTSDKTLPGLHSFYPYLLFVCYLATYLL